MSKINLSIGCELHKKQDVKFCDNVFYKSHKTKFQS